MRVEVRLFAVAGDLAGRRTVEVELPAGATVADLRRALTGQWPALEALGPRLLIAVNQDYAPDDRVLAPGDEVAGIPPVSGG